MYKPQVTQVNPNALPAELHPVLEQLAEKVHDAWAAERIRKNWVYGPLRDDVKKTHPCLVPYSQLPESEQEYDRITAAQAIQFLLDMGYSITKKEPL